MTHSWAIGVDVGGTKCAAGLVCADDGKILSRRQVPTNASRGGAAVLADIVDLAIALREEGGRLDAAPWAIGVGVAELVDPQGRVLSDATIGWRSIEVAREISAQTRLPVFLDADVRAAARAEVHFGAGRGLASFLYVTVGTGISASLVIDGKPYVGARGLTGTCASSRGLIPTDDGTLAGGPALEQYAAGPALASRFASEGGDSTATAREVFSFCESGNELARSVVASAGEALGAAIGQMVNLLDPEAVVIGGGLGLAGGLYRESVDRAMRNHIWSDLHRDVPLLSAELGVDAGVIGAALFALER